jgi:hypothetical protein
MLVATISFPDDAAGLPEQETPKAATAKMADRRTRLRRIEYLG